MLILFFGLNYYCEYYENFRISNLTQLTLNTDSYTSGVGAGSIGSRIIISKQLIYGEKIGLLERF